MSVRPENISRPELELSVVIPVYNEEGNIDKLHGELTEALVEIGCDYEVIVINDGSQDRSYDMLNAVHARDPRWQIIHFRRNFGQTAAMAAGFDAARGEIVVTMDADLQNDQTTSSGCSTNSPRATISSAAGAKTAKNPCYCGAFRLPWRTA